MGDLANPKKKNDLTWMKKLANGNHPQMSIGG